MVGKLQIDVDGSILAGKPASFQVTFVSEIPIEVGGRLRLLYDYRGSDPNESSGQTTESTNHNYISCISANGISPHLRTYSVAHSYKPPWSEEPECFLWLDLLGPEVSLNCHVIEAVFTDKGIPAGGQVTFHFGANGQGYHLTRKSYRAYPIWAILDPTGEGFWQAAKKATIQVHPSTPTRLMITLPSIACVGEEKSLHLQTFDAEFNPTDDIASISVSTTPGLDTNVDKRIARFTAVGEQWLEPDGSVPLTVESNPSLVVEEPTTNRIFWGDIHGHSNVCDGGIRSPEEYFTWARDVLALDFCALTTHDFGIALSDPETQWPKLETVVNRFDRPNSFVTFVAWEASHIGLPAGWSVGHKNLLFKEDQAPFINGSSYGTHRVRVDYRSYNELIKHLQHLDCLVIPHHSLNPVLPGGLGTNWNEFWSDHERIAEIYSLWGSSESMDTPGRTVDAVEGTSVLTALMRGYRLGFTAGSDTHDGRPANRCEPWGTGASAGLTAVFAPCLTREAVYDALWQRRCYGTTGARIILFASIEGTPMGQTRSVSVTDSATHQRIVRIQVVGTSEIDRVEVIRNGQLVHTFADLDTNHIEETWTDCAPLPMIALADEEGQRFVFYYVRVHQKDGHRAWSSPTWFDLEDTHQ